MAEYLLDPPNSINWVKIPLLFWNQAEPNHRRRRVSINIIVIVGDSEINNLNFLPSFTEFSWLMFRCYTILLEWHHNIISHTIAIRTWSRKVWCDMNSEAATRFFPFSSIFMGNYPRIGNDRVFKSNVDLFNKKMN